MRATYIQKHTSQIRRRALNHTCSRVEARSSVKSTAKVNSVRISALHPLCLQTTTAVVDPRTYASRRVRTETPTRPRASAEHVEGEARREGEGETAGTKSGLPGTHRTRAVQRLETSETPTTGLCRESSESLASGKLANSCHKAVSLGPGRQKQKEDECGG
jgi:hypothetical protein